MSTELQVFLLIAVIIAASKLGGHVSRLLGQPIVFGEILVGLLLGPSLLNLFGWPVFAAHGPWLHELTAALAGVGVLLLMFVAGLETDLAQMRRVGRIALAAATGGVVAPLILGALTALLFGLSLREAIFIGAVLTATSVSISAQTLMEMGRLRSKEGMTILGAAVIDDVMGIIILSFVIAFAAVKGAGHAVIPALPTAAAGGIASAFGRPDLAGVFEIVTICLFMAAFFALAVYFGRFVDRILTWSRGLHASHSLAACALVLMLLYAVGAEYLGKIAAITGAYVFGVIVAQTSHRERIEHALHPLTYALFVPIFFLSIGLGADLSAFSAGGKVGWIFVAVLVVVAVITKVVGAALGAGVAGFPYVRSLRVGIGMISRGEVGLIIAQLGLASGVIDASVYAAMVVMVLVTTVITPVLLRASFPARETEVDADDVPVGLTADELAEREAYESIGSVNTPRDEG